MLCALFISFTILATMPVMSQSKKFNETVRTLFFDVDINSSGASLVDSFKKVKHLHYIKRVTCQTNLNVSMQMGGDLKARACKHKFTFISSPIPDLKISSGYLDINIGETKRIKKVLDFEYRIQFDLSNDASAYFEKLKLMFDSVSTDKKLEFDKDIGYIAQFASRKEHAQGTQGISIILSKPITGEKNEILVLLGSDFIDE